MSNETVQTGIRLSAGLKADIEAAAKAQGFTSWAEWIRVQLTKATKEALAEATP